MFYSTAAVRVCIKPHKGRVYENGVLCTWMYAFVHSLHVCVFVCVYLLQGTREFMPPFSFALLCCGLAAMSLWELSCLTASIAPLFIKLKASRLCCAVCLCASGNCLCVLILHHSIWWQCNSVWRKTWRATELLFFWPFDFLVSVKV